MDQFSRSTRQAVPAQPTSSVPFSIQSASHGARVVPELLRHCIDSIQARSFLSLVGQFTNDLSCLVHPTTDQVWRDLQVTEQVHLSPLRDSLLATMRQMTEVEETLKSSFKTQGLSAVMAITDCVRVDLREVLSNWDAIVDTLWVVNSRLLPEYVTKKRAKGAPNDRGESSSVYGPTADNLDTNTLPSSDISEQGVNAAPELPSFGTALVKDFPIYLEALHSKLKGLITALSFDIRAPHKPEPLELNTLVHESMISSYEPNFSNDICPILSTKNEAAFILNNIGQLLISTYNNTTKLLVDAILNDDDFWCLPQNRFVETDELKIVKAIAQDEIQATCTILEKGCVKLSVAYPKALRSDIEFMSDSLKQSIAWMQKAIKPWGVYLELDVNPGQESELSCSIIFPEATKGEISGMSLPPDCPLIRPTNQERASFEDTDLGFERATLSGDAAVSYLVNTKGHALLNEESRTSMLTLLKNLDPIVATQPKLNTANIGIPDTCEEPQTYFDMGDLTIKLDGSLIEPWEHTKVMLGSTLWTPFAWEHDEDVGASLRPSEPEVITNPPIEHLRVVIAGDYLRYDDTVSKLLAKIMKSGNPAYFDFKPETEETPSHHSDEWMMRFLNALKLDLEKSCRRYHQTRINFSSQPIEDNTSKHCYFVRYFSLAGELLAHGFFDADKNVIEHRRVSPPLMGETLARVTDALGPIEPHYRQSSLHLYLALKNRGVIAGANVILRLMNDIPTKEMSEKDYGLKVAESMQKILEDPYLIVQRRKLPDKSRRYILVHEKDERWDPLSERP